MDLKDLCQTIMTRSEAAILATVDHHGHPDIRAMVNLHNTALYPGQAKVLEPFKDRLSAVFTTLSTSSKTRQIQSNPRVAVYYCVPAEFLGITLFGVMEILDDDDLKRSLFDDSWRIYYPDGPLDPRHTLMRLAPEKIHGWRDTEKFILTQEASWKS